MSSSCCSEAFLRPAFISDDPKSVEAAYRVVGTKVTDSRRFTCHDEDTFEKLFGTGVRLKDITIERAEEPVTATIGKYLPLLSSLKAKGRTLSGESFFTDVSPQEKILT